MTSRVLMALLVIAGLALVMAGTAIGADRPAAQSAIRDGAGSGPSRALAHAPLSFTANRGQWPDSILYRAEAEGATLWFTRDGIYYQFFRRIPRAVSAVSEGSLERVLFHERDSVETAMIKAEFAGASESVEVAGLDELGYKCSYFIGNDPAKWHADVPSYSSIEMKGLYPGVDVTFRGNQGRMEYELRTVSGSSADQVRIAYRGATTMAQADGSVVLHTSLGDKVFLGMLPVAQGVRISTQQGVRASSVSGLTLAYATYLGGGSVDLGQDIAVDGSGNAYVTGHTQSADFPTLSAYQSAQGNWDVFVTKMSAAGNTPVYSTYLGGAGGDWGKGIALDNSGSVYVAGWTESPNFPTKNPYQADQAGPDVFVTKLSAAGNSLVYSTYLGGSDTDQGYDLAVDGNGAVYVTGVTYSTNYPTLNAYQADQAFDDVFVTKLSAAGNSLLYSTYLGGDNSEIGENIALDRDGYAYVTGATWSTDYPTQNPFLTDQSGIDAFLTKLSSSGNTLVYSTYLGGTDSNSSTDYGYGIAVDASGSAYVTGYTESPSFPTLGPYQTAQGSWDVFVTKFSAAGSSLIYSTYLGGSVWEWAYGIAVDGSGNAYVAGYANSPDFPTHNSFQSYQGNSDCFVTKLSAAGNSLLYSTFLGGAGDDNGSDIALDDSGYAYVTGQTGSSNFPTQGPYQTDQGDVDAFVVKLAPSCPIAVTGDVNISGSITSADVITLVNYVFKSGLPPQPCVAAGDVNCNGSVTSADVISLVNFVFKGGTPPCDGCTSALAAGC